MPWPLAILVTLGLLAVGSQGPGYLMVLIVLGTAVWAAYDSKDIRLTDYKSGISYKPSILAFAILFLWIVGFPWYLIVRGKIKAGTAERR